MVDAGRAGEPVRRTLVVGPADDVPRGRGQREPLAEPRVVAADERGRLVGRREERPAVEPVLGGEREQAVDVPGLPGRRAACVARVRRERLAGVRQDAHGDAAAAEAADDAQAPVVRTEDEGTGRCRAHGRLRLEARRDAGHGRHARETSRASCRAAKPEPATKRMSGP